MYLAGKEWVDGAYNSIFGILFLERLKLKDFPAHLKPHVCEIVHEMMRQNWEEIFKVGDKDQDYADHLHLYLKEHLGRDLALAAKLSKIRFGFWSLRDCIRLHAAIKLSKPPMTFKDQCTLMMEYSSGDHHVINPKPGISKVVILFPALEGCPVKSLCGAMEEN